MDLTGGKDSERLNCDDDDDENNDKIWMKLKNLVITVIRLIMRMIISTVVNDDYYNK